MFTMVSWRSWLPTVFVAVATLAGSRISRGEVTRWELAAIQREVLTTLARESRAEAFDARQRAVADLLALHERLGADGRFQATPALQALRRRVAGRLVRVKQALADEAAHTEPAAARSGGAVPADLAGGGRQAEAQKLIDLIQATVRPETWDVNGGRGSIVYFANGHGLVVRAPDDVHDDLGGLLRQLR